MSGGHFNYGCFKISQFADELAMEIRVNDDETVDEFGSVRGYGYSKQVIDVLTSIQATLDVAGKIAKEVEWLYSGDIGETDFIEAVVMIFKEDGE